MAKLRIHSQGVSLAVWKLWGAAQHVLGTQPSACAVSLLIVLHIKMSLVTTDTVQFPTLFKKYPNKPKHALLSKREIS